jgi:hypothetical protein
VLVNYSFKDKSLDKTFPWTIGCWRSALPVKSASVLFRPF